MAYYYSPFRKQYDKKEKKTSSDGCVFCNFDKVKQQAVINAGGQIIENSHYVWLVNYFPRHEGHTLLIPKKHVVGIGEESPDQVFAREQLFAFASKMLRKLYPGAGIEIFNQTGEGSLASIEHLHWHIVPAQPSDPLRSFEKLGHFYTVDEKEEKVIVFPVEIEKACEGLQRELADVIGMETL